ncbi:MAG: 23S rRNA (adenine(2503)-C(2))-methyltransferase RlmN [Candidatus Latescibacteria bacterium]|nr:23S rRNA (adenine(2503)-C(2))-methyltransferase RlmN [bacterium]MBD3424503.1 23S rRNA (adenine(2503)-C(2))-methyltransferase RlmN [Candidatus Latescibacterota bacterium]
MPGNILTPSNIEVILEDRPGRGLFSRFRGFCKQKPEITAPQIQAPLYRTDISGQIVFITYHFLNKEIALKKTNIKNLSIDELHSIIDDLGEKNHRKSQLMKWLYQKGVEDFSEMTNIPVQLREWLDARYRISSLAPAEAVESPEDGSTKFLMECDDGLMLEAVLMEFEKHQTICISTQIGCPLRCLFCNTGMQGFERDLRSDEILNQVLYFRKAHIRPRRRFNIVFMGMGEPFLNLENLYRSMEILNHQDGFALGEKRITVSTIGFPGKIIDAADSGLKFSLAISLSGTEDRSRKELMPGSAPIMETLSAAEYFAEKSGTRTTLEYVLIAGVNDTEENARALSDLTAGRPFKINLIPLNEWIGSELRRPSEERIDHFISILLPRAPAVTVRRSRGRDISAACGQLRFHRRD